MRFSRDANHKFVVDAVQRGYEGQSDGFEQPATDSCRLAVFSLKRDDVPDNARPNIHQPSGNGFADAYADTNLYPNPNTYADTNVYADTNRGTAERFTFAITNAALKQFQDCCIPFSDRSSSLESSLTRVAAGHANVGTAPVKGR